jgi:hypothetical protein
VLIAQLIPFITTIIDIRFKTFNIVLLRIIGLRMSIEKKVIEVNMDDYFREKDL